MQGLEKYLMTKIYAKTFAVSELDRERDQALYLRMKALKFVKPEHLDLPPSYKGMEAITRAQEQLAKINNYKVGMTYAFTQILKSIATTLVMACSQTFC